MVDHPIRNTQLKCKHDSQFRCTTISTAQQDNYFYAFACSQSCGYFMNFNPIAAGEIENKRFPKNADKHWRDIGVIYLDNAGKRSDGQEWKTMLPFASEGTKMGRI